MNGNLTLIKRVTTGLVNEEDPDNACYMEYRLVDGEMKLIEKKKQRLGD